MLNVFVVYTSLAEVQGICADYTNALNLASEIKFDGYELYSMNHSYGETVFEFSNGDETEFKEIFIKEMEVKDLSSVEMPDCIKHNDKTIIKVEMINGEKYMRFIGYSSFADTNADKPFVLVRYSDMVSRIEEVLKKGVSDYEELMKETCKTAVCSVSSEELNRMYQEYYKDLIPIDEGNISEDISCGNYVL